MNNFVKARNKTRISFMCLRNKSPRISDAKIKECNFLGPHITKLIKDNNVDVEVNEDEKAA